MKSIHQYELEKLFCIEHGPKQKAAPIPLCEYREVHLEMQLLVLRKSRAVKPQ
jgi:hypothetical protein